MTGTNVVAIYGDGGCIGSNPSPIGAPWAVCAVDADGKRAWTLTGVVRPDEVETEGATNNQSEFMAILSGLEKLPDGWSGTIYSDSLVTIRRFRDGARLKGIPDAWSLRMGAALRRLGTLEYVLLDGHPKKEHLAAGVGKRGNPVSEHNVWVDKQCTEVGRLFLERVGAPVYLIEPPEPTEPMSVVSEAVEPPTTYHAFLETKRIVVRSSGLDVPPSAVHPSRFGFQRDLVSWSLRKGRAAVFAATGLGKAGMAIETCRLSGRRSLILAPLGVVPQFVDEGHALGVEVTPARDRSEAHPTGITVANYDRLHRFHLEDFGCVGLDESAILRDFEGKTRARLIEACRDVEYRFAYSAVPAPNDVAELANHAEFLGICTRVEMLATWFVHDDQGWRLKGHAREPFYRWLAGWAMSVKRPSDLGGDDSGYDLPELSIRPVIVPTDYVPEGQLFATGLHGVADRARVRRSTVADRVAAAVRLVDAEPDESWALWCGLNDEQDALAAALGDRCVSIDGRTTERERERLYPLWRSGERKALVTKGAVFGRGMNWQHCARTAFVGLSDSFEAYHQIVRRFWRFGQTRPVHAYVVLTDLEEPIYANVLRKEREFEAMTSELVKHVGDFQRAEIGQIRQRDQIVHAQPLVLPAWLRGAA